MTYSCRFCQAYLDISIINLGHQPPSNSYLQCEQLELSEKISYSNSRYDKMELNFFFKFRN